MATSTIKNDVVFERYSAGSHTDVDVPMAANEKAIIFAAGAGNAKAAYIVNTTSANACSSLEIAAGSSSISIVDGTSKVTIHNGLSYTTTILVIRYL